MLRRMLQETRYAFDDAKFIGLDNNCFHYLFSRAYTEEHWDTTGGLDDECQICTRDDKRGDNLIWGCSVGKCDPAERNYCLDYGHPGTPVT